MTKVSKEKSDQVTIAKIPTKLLGQVKQENDDDDADTAVETPFNSPERESAASPNSADTKEEEEQVVHAEIILSKETNANGDYSNWPLKRIKDPHANDVLYGRGGGTNHHPGNKRYRKLVEARKVNYVNSKRLDKPLVALEIIKGWRAQKPPGRFLKIDDQSGLWDDVGDKKAREKTSQALREKAPLLRKQQEEERKEKATENDSLLKNTRFDLPEKTRKVDKNLSRVILARDHSLGRDYITANDTVSVKGFSWTAPALDVPTVPIGDVPKSDSWEKNREPDLPVAYAVRGSGSSRPQTSNHLSPPDPYVSSGQYPGTHSQDLNPVGYNGEWAAQFPHTPHTPHPLTPHTPHPHTNDMLNEWRAFHSDDVMRKSYGDNESNYLQTRSADDGYRRNRPTHPYYHQDNPSNSSHVESNDYERFATIVGSNSAYNIANWTSMNGQPRQNSESMYDSASSYHSPDRMRSSDSYSRGQSWTSPHADQTSPQSSIDYYNSSGYRQKADTLLPSPYHNIPSPSSREDIPRPPTVKRDTSNKLKTMDVEPTKKRMNRQSSMSSVDEITEHDIRRLKNSLEQSTLAVSERSLKKPHNLKFADRVDTIDRIIVDLECASSPLDGQTKSEHRGSESSINIDEVITKPSPIHDEDRLSTIGTLDIDNEFFGGITSAAPV